LRVLGLSTSWQYAVYGAAIAAGMVISGDRIVGALGSVLRHPRFRAWVEPAASVHEPVGGGGM
jgi:hypothetical protein